MNLTKPWGKLIEPFVRYTMKNHEFLFIFSVLMWSLPAGRTSSGTLETRYGGGEELSRSRYFCSLGDWVWVVLWESISQEGQVICVGWGMDDLVDWVFNGVSVFSPRAVHSGTMPRVYRPLLPATPPCSPAWQCLLASSTTPRVSQPVNWPGLTEIFWPPKRP